MSKSKRRRGDPRRIRVRGIRRDDPDLRAIGRVLIDFAIAEDEAAARAEQESRQRDADQPATSDDDGAAA